MEHDAASLTVPAFVEIRPGAFSSVEDGEIRLIAGKPELILDGKTYRIVRRLTQSLDGRFERQETWVPGRVRRPKGCTEVPGEVEVEPGVRKPIAEGEARIANGRPELTLDGKSYRIGMRDGVEAWIPALALVR